MLTSASIAELTERCQEETLRFQQTKQTNPIYCFTLFQRALTDSSDGAWQALLTQYDGLVSHWAYEYGAHDLDEEVSSFVNEAFTRMWQYGRKPETAAKLDSLKKCLGYLKKCVWSSVEDYRQKQREAILVDDWQPFEGLMPQVDTPERIVFRQMVGQRLWEQISAILQNDQERITAELTWIYDYKPRQIQKKHPDLFTSAAQVSQVRKNIIKRLKRKLAATDF
ncbi:MAG: sigma-70 family RNA polymerase sigma factor [Chloroflexota bacterium]